jgi:transposase, IS5 family
VPTSEKIYSIFEPDTDLIKRGKVRMPVEFGHKVFLAESAVGFLCTTRTEVEPATAQPPVLPIFLPRYIARLVK